MEEGLQGQEFGSKHRTAGSKRHFGESSGCRGKSGLEERRGPPEGPSASGRSQRCSLLAPTEHLHTCRLPSLIETRDAL